MGRVHQGLTCSSGGKGTVGEADYDLPAGCAVKNPPILSIEVPAYGLEDHRNGAHCGMKKFRNVWRVGAVGVALVAPALLRAQGTAAQRTDTITGTVRTADGVPLNGALVSVTRGPDRAVLRDSTDASGRFRVIFVPGTGDYLVHVASAGWLPERRRVSADESGRVPLVAMQMRPAPVLATVRVQAVRPTRSTATVPVGDPGVGAHERWVDGANGQVSPLQAGDLSATAATLPGTVVTPGGLSVAGAAPTSTLTTLNGLELTTGTLPRSVRTEVRLASTTFDATRGGFSGANLDVRLAPGDRNVQRRTLYVSAQPGRVGARPSRALQEASSRAGRGSLGADGELVRGRVLYNVALDAQQATRAPTSWPLAAASLARESAIPIATLERMAARAAALGLPLGDADAPTTASVSALSRLDWLTDSLASVTLTTLWNRTSQANAGVTATGTPRMAFRAVDDASAVHLSRNNYVGPGRRVLTQQRVGLSVTTTSSKPEWTTVPEIRVSPYDATAESTPAATHFSVGGSSRGGMTDRRVLLEGVQDVYWNARGRTHRWHALVGARTETLRSTAAPNAAGSFLFPSVDAFTANTPATFQRQLSARHWSGQVWNGALAINDEWSQSRRLTLSAGLRVDGAGTLGGTPTPSRLTPRWTLSPRFGFTYVYSTRPADGVTSALNPAGRFTRGQLGVIRGGVGRFQDLLRPGMVGGETGSAPILLQCIGDSSPGVNLQAPPPTSCLAGHPALAQQSVAPLRIAPDFAAPATWRASANWSTALRRVALRVDGLASWGTHRPGMLDENWQAGTGFVLPSEGARVVHVPLAGIDPRSGAVSLRGSRRDLATGLAFTRVSDLAAHAGALTLTVAPHTPAFRPGLPVFGSLSYTLQGARESLRGFDAPSRAAPTERIWAPSFADVRHVVVMQGGITGQRIGAWTVFLRAQSGAPFTPMVQGDITGDGLANDPAYIPRVSGPGGTDDPAVRAAMAAAVSGFPSYAQSCVLRSAGQVAGRGSCRGPWAPSLSVQWMPPLKTTLWGRSLGASVYFENPLGGLDQLLHGSGALRGWGGPRLPDPVLLVPRAFDPSTARFAYAVNPRFGSTRGVTSGLVRPFRVAVEMSIDLSVPFAVQTLRRALEPPVRGKAGTRTADSLATFLVRRRVGNLFQFVLAESDSLFLTPTQIAALRTASAAYTAEARSRYVPLGHYLAGRSAKAVGPAALDTVKATEAGYQQQFWRAVEHMATILTPSQRQLLPILDQMLATPPARRPNAFFGFGHLVDLFPRAAPGAPPP